jgi:peroxiredoxin Q/BCP
VLGISFDSEKKNRAFAEKYDFPFRLLCDTDRKIGLAYGACDEPTAGAPRRITYVIDTEGRIAQAHEKVNPREHAEQLLATL